ncbi:MAG: hypothetical protein AAGU11_05250 [Syntrophobacteraceae bacterium]
MKRIVSIGICLLLAAVWASTGICQPAKPNEPAKAPAAGQTTQPAAPEAKKKPETTPPKPTNQEAQPWQVEERVPGKFNPSEGC